MYLKYFKRLMDIIFSLIIIIILSPLYLIIGLLVKYHLGSPIIFKQQRPGLNEKTFTIYKFRTMTNELDNKQHLLSDELRLTKFGKFLRSTSLDEIPEFLNVLKGDMSIVGPRPLLVEFLPHYNKAQRKRHNVKPGITGLAQINGRNSISWKDKFDYDLTYIENITFINDFKIILKTIITVIKKEGINQEGQATFEYFKGNE